MLQKDKKREALLEEDKDFYLSFLNKRLRNARKKLEQIEELSKKDLSSLKPEQIEKVKSRDEVSQTIQHFEGLKDLYYSAYKTAIEEGKVTPKEKVSEKSPKENKIPEAPKVETQEVSRDEIVRDTLQKVVNLLVCHQTLENPTHKEELSKSCGNINQLQQFCRWILNLSQVDEDTPIVERQTEGLERLTNYLKLNERTALEEQSFKYFQENIESVVGSSSFRNIVLKKPEEQTRTEEIHESSDKKIAVVEERQELERGADFLQPDTNDFGFSTENTPKPTKGVKFVDEIEKDLEQSSRSQEKGENGTKSILKESRDRDVQNPQDEREGRDQNDYRKKRNNYDDYGKPRKHYDNNRRGQPKKNNGYGNSGYKEKGYSRGGYENEASYRPQGNTRYQEKIYVEKKSQEA